MIKKQDNGSYEYVGVATTVQQVLDVTGIMFSEFMLDAIQDKIILEHWDSKTTVGQKYNDLQEHGHFISNLDLQHYLNLKSRENKNIELLDIYKRIGEIEYQMKLDRQMQLETTTLILDRLNEISGKSDYIDLKEIAEMLGYTNYRSLHRKIKQDGDLYYLEVDSLRFEIFKRLNRKWEAKRQQFNLAFREYNTYDNTRKRKKRVSVKKCK